MRGDSLKAHKYDNYNNIVSYWYGNIKENGFFNLVLRASKYTRRYFFISKIIKYAAAVIAFIETSATLVVVFTALVIMIPVSLLTMLVTAIINIFQYKKLNPEIAYDIEKSDKIIFIDAKKGYNRKRKHYLNHMAESFICEGYTVFVISHSLFSDRFTAARKEGESLWVVKLNYFFVIKRLFLRGKEEIITYIY